MSVLRAAGEDLFVQLVKDQEMKKRAPVKAISIEDGPRADEVIVAAQKAMALPRMING